jgi:hypothetical protein
MLCNKVLSIRNSTRFSSQLIWLTAFEKVLDDALSQLPRKLSLASDNDEDICMELF